MIQGCPMKLIITTLSMIFISFGANAYSDWKSSQSKDEMTGKETFYIFTSWASSKYPMSFPYSKTKSVIGVACNKDSIWSYFMFTTQPNITKSETKDGYNKILTRIKFDDTLENVTLTQDWGSKALFLYNEKAFIKSLQNTSEVLLELKWHGNNSVYFKYFTEGASEEIEGLKAKCKIK